MEKKIRIAVIGTGKAGHMHAKALLNIEQGTLVAVHSRDKDKAALFAKTYQAKPYTDISEMIKKEAVDMVVVCNPHPDHKYAAICAFEAGAHVLVEKPLASSLEDCDAMINAAGRHHKNLGVVSQRRFYPPAIRVKKAIDEGKIGKPALGIVMLLGWRDPAYYASDPWRGSWKEEGGGVLVNQAPHQLDLLQWFMNDEIEELYGVWKNLNHPSIEVEDTAVAVVKFRSGGIGNIVVSNSQKPGIYGKVHIHGSNGSSVGVQTDGGSMFIAGISNISEPPKNDLWTIPGEEHHLAQWDKEDTELFSSIDPVEYYIRQQNQDFVNSILMKNEPRITGKEGRKTVEVFTAIYRSMKTNKPVKWPLDQK